MKGKSILVIGILVAVLSFSTIFAAPKERITISKLHKTPEFISGRLTTVSDKEPQEIVFDYLDSNRDRFKFSSEKSNNSFKILSQHKDSLGYTYLRLQQLYKGLPVFGSTQTAHINERGELTSFSGAVIPNIDKQKSLKFDEEVEAKEAIEIAQKDLGFKPKYEIMPTCELVIYPCGEKIIDVYLVRLKFAKPQTGNWYYFIDPSSGEVVHKFNSIHDRSVPSKGEGRIELGIRALENIEEINNFSSPSQYYLYRAGKKDIKIYDEENKYFILRGKIPKMIWKERCNSSINLYASATSYDAIIHDYCLNTLERHSFDKKDTKIQPRPHYSSNNGGWPGYKMIYGNPESFRELSRGIDVVAHELTHVVTKHRANLIYENESGAISRAMSDIFGAVVEFYANNDPDWLLKENICTPNIDGNTIRSMSNPTVCGYPDHYGDRYRGSKDNGGVNRNSSIINKAAYLISNGGTHYGVTINGIGMDKMASIFYRALTQHLTQSSTFSQLRAALVQSATELYGGRGVEVQAIEAAFNSVGIQ